MCIMESKAIAPTYYVIRDIRRNGKSSTEIIENSVKASEIRRKYNVDNADIWVNEYICKLRNDKLSANRKVLITFNTDLSVEKDKSLSFNVGYLFL